jgi:hypothetical protein
MFICHVLLSPDLLSTFHDYCRPYLPQMQYLLGVFMQKSAHVEGVRSWKTEVLALAKLFGHEMEIDTRYELMMATSASN